MATETPDNAAGAPPETKSNLVPILIVVGIIVVIVIGAGVYFLTRDDDSGGGATGDPPPRIAKDLYAAWQADDRTAAGRIATAEAVDEIFDIDRTEGADLEFGGCERIGATVLPRACVFTRPGGQLTITVSIVDDARVASGVELGPAGLPPDTTG